MKILTSLILFLFIGYSGFSQVGINTTDPTTTLDVNGNLRVRGVGERSFNPIQATKVVGMDDEGNFVDILLEENLVLDNNVLKHIKTQETIYNRPTISTPVVDNASDIIWPGGAGDKRSVTKITTSVGDVIITGVDISAFPTPFDAHGYTVALYSVSGEIRLKSEDGNSQAMNQFILSDGNDLNLKRYETVKIMYDGQLQKWLVISRH